MASGSRRFDKLSGELTKKIDEYDEKLGGADPREYVKYCVAFCVLHQRDEEVVSSKTHKEALDLVRATALRRYRNANRYESETNGLLRQLSSIFISVCLFILGYMIKDKLSATSEQSQNVIIVVGVIFLGIMIGFLIRHLYYPMRKRVSGYFLIVSDILLKRGGGKNV
uniref:hypothetical protein n=1 Tax=Pararhizobium sp. IMCC3301 TaxID=3067904 RepID=UPI0027411FD1|nr:hypothetical protein [Pararhizobium sp. IMCC3301]